jgi:adenylate cyclase
LQQSELYVANVGDAQAMLIHSEGGHCILTRKHDPAEPNERQRIRDAGGWVSRQGKLNDILEVSRAFGYVQITPAVQAAPHITQIAIKEQDEMILIASRELWEYLSPELVVDVARYERGDLMRAAQRLRDLAMAFGATNKLMVMMIGVSDLKKRAQIRPHRVQSLSLASQLVDDGYTPNTKKPKRKGETVQDSMLRRLQAEVQAPIGDVSIVFTDIKSSTLLWETYPSAMQSAIKLHNEVMRRQLRIIGGYEVKTEGDAFMVSFPTATSALLWCFAVQQQLLEVQWPSEILSSVLGQEIYDNDQTLIFKGLSVRMGIHWGRPVCENDPVTRRMDYFGPMVNRASRISGVADGGQVTVSADFISEIQRCLETYSEITIVRAFRLPRRVDPIKRRFRHLVLSSFHPDLVNCPHAVPTARGVFPWLDQFPAEASPPAFLPVPCWPRPARLPSHRPQLRPAQRPSRQPLRNQPSSTYRQPRITARCSA